jgi:hypothetical protein
MEGPGPDLQYSEVRSLGVIPNRAEAVGRLFRRLGKPEQLRVCYEAGPTPGGWVRCGASSGRKNTPLVE